jgi:membrane-associated phospholipid phosphatase
MTVTGGAAAAQPSMSWLRQIFSNVAQGLSLLFRAPRARTKPRWRAYSRLAVGALIAIIALACVMVFVDAWMDASIKRVPHWLMVVFAELTDFGRSGWFLVPLAILLVAIATLATEPLPRFSRLVLAGVAVRLGFVFAAIAVPGLLISVVKRLIGRARPFIDIPPDPFHYTWGVWRADYASFPSGHATAAFAAAIAIGLIWPRLRALMWIYALVIALSRVVVAAHHPSDVIAGAIAGILGALLVRDWLAARRLGFFIHADGRVSTLPGPSLARIKRVAHNLLAS